MKVSIVLVLALLLISGLLIACGSSEEEIIAPASPAIRPSPTSIATPTPDYFDIALQRLDEGKYEQAMAALDKALELDPDNVELHWVRGEANFEIGEFEEALDDLTQVIKRDPGLTDAYSMRGAIYVMDRDDI